MAQAKVCNFIYVIMQNSKCIDAYLIFTHSNLNLAVHIHRLALKLLIWMGKHRRACQSASFPRGIHVSTHFSSVCITLVNIRIPISIRCSDTSPSIKCIFFPHSLFSISILLICIFSYMHLRFATKVHSVASTFPVRLSVLAIKLQFLLLFKTNIFFCCHLKR